MWSVRQTFIEVPVFRWLGASSNMLHRDNERPGSSQDKISCNSDGTLYLVVHLLFILHAQIIAYSARYKITSTIRAYLVWKIKRTSWNDSSPPENWTILRRWNNEIIAKMVKRRAKEWSINWKRCTRREERIVQFVRIFRSTQYI